MIQLKRIRTSDQELYKYAERLLTTSFPLEEYRPLSQWRKYTDENEQFYNNIILDQGKPVGIISFWDLGSFYYIEHFAIDEELRNKGYGQTVLDLLEKNYDIPMILEVELPTNATAQRRIIFYQRYHFEVWDREYVQPPYRPNGAAVPMMLMSRGNLSCEKDFDAVQTKLYQVVYHVAED